MSAPALQLQRVSRRFEEGGGHVVHAVEDLSLELWPGSLTLVLGPSGCGKTTLLLMAGGLLAPSAGEVQVAGTRLTTLSQARLTEFRLRRIGFVFQRSRLLEGLSALENIELPMTLAGRRRPATFKRAGELAGRVGLHDRLDADAGVLSGGEQQRVALARALANDPAVILADEPTGSLDSHSGRQIIRLLLDAARDGATVLVVTHDARIEPFADAVIHMEDGRIQAVGEQSLP
jgi:ABC-type lipoprotein export system ATPase subunit